MFLGGTLGVSFKVSESIRVLPEVGVTVPVLWTGDSEAICQAGACPPFVPGAIIAHAAIGLTFGSFHVR